MASLVHTAEPELVTKAAIKVASVLEVEAMDISSFSVEGEASNSALSRLSGLVRDDYEKAQREKWLQGLSYACAALAEKIQTAAAQEIAVRFVSLLTKPQQQGSWRLASLSDVVGMIAHKIGPASMLEVAEMLIGAMDNPELSDSEQLSLLGRALGGLCRTLAHTRYARLLAVSNILLAPVSQLSGEGELQPFDRKVFEDMCLNLQIEDLTEILKREFDGDLWKFVKEADSLAIKGIDSPAKRPSASVALKELNALLGS